MKLPRTMLLAVLTLALSWDTCTADQEGAQAAYGVAYTAEADAAGWRNQAEYMRDDGLGVKANSLLIRVQCVAFNATDPQLNDCDNAVDMGDNRRAVGAGQYAGGSVNDANGQAFMVVALGHVNGEEWADAVTSYVAAKAKFVAAAADYEIATTDGYYNAYESYNTAFDRFETLLAFLMN